MQRFFVTRRENRFRLCKSPPAPFFSAIVDHPPSVAAASYGAAG
jgi:hypothetical protein